MRAAWYCSNGKAQDVLQVGELPVPDPGPGEVRVKVAVSGINPSDVKSRGGSRPVTSDRVVPHSDGAGVIDKVGSGVAPSRIGERVWIWNGQWQRPMGTAAEYIALPQEHAVRLPDTADFEAGACLGIPALTALHAVKLLGDIAGKTVLVIGASSAVGYYAAQIARLQGARVIGTVGSAQKAALAGQIGVAHTINYKTEPVGERLKELTADRGVDAIVDMDFSTTAPLVSGGALAAHGTVACYGSNARGEVPINFGMWLPRSLNLRFFLVYDLLPDDRSRAIDHLARLLDAGSLQHKIGQRFALEDIVAAHEAVESGKVLGNVVLTI